MKPEIGSIIKINNQDSLWFVQYSGSRNIDFGHHDISRCEVCDLVPVSTEGIPSFDKMKEFCNSFNDSSKIKSFVVVAEKAQFKL